MTPSPPSVPPKLPGSPVPPLGPLEWPLSSSYSKIRTMNLGPLLSLLGGGPPLNTFRGSESLLGFVIIQDHVAGALRGGDCPSASSFPAP
jgi:hypothetical protein